MSLSGFEEVSLLLLLELLPLDDSLSGLSESLGFEESLVDLDDSLGLEEPLLEDDLDAGSLVDVLDEEDEDVPCGFEDVLVEEVLLPLPPLEVVEVLPELLLPPPDGLLLVLRPEEEVRESRGIFTDMFYFSEFS